jgi:branched-chain amino acid transport system substrate-binding protein
LRSLAAALALALAASPALAQEKIKVGMMLPYTGTFAALGNAITNGFKLAIAEQGGKLGGRDFEYVTVDDESDPAKAPENVNKLIKRDNVDVIVGTVHSGVAMAMAKAAKDNNALLLIPNAGQDEITGALCAPNIIRTSFANSAAGFAMGKVAAERGYKNVVTLAWKYGAGDQSVAGFKEAFEKGGGKVVKELSLPFPNVEFQPFLTEIASIKPDAVYVFFAGGGAVKLVKDYDAAGLRKTIPLLGPGFITDGTLEAQGAAADGLLTTLHYADELDNPKNNAFRGAGLRHRTAARRGDECRRRRRQEARCADQGDADGEDRVAARTVLAVEGQQPGAGLLPAPGRERQEQVHRHRDQGLRGSGDRLQDVTTSR